MSNTTASVPLDIVDTLSIIILPLLIVVHVTNQLGNMSTYMKIPIQDILPWLKIMVLQRAPISPVTVPRVLFERKIVLDAILKTGVWWDR